MKITAFLVLAVMLQVSATSFGQKVSLSEKNAQLEQVLKKIKQQTGYDLLYGDNVLNKDHKVTVNVKNVTLTEALDQVLKDQKLSYSVKERTIIIREKEQSLLDKASSVILNSVQDLAKNLAAIDVRGKVVDSLGNGLAGATVSVKGASKSTQTAQNGDFYLKNIEQGAVLVITYLGYMTKEQLASAEHNFIILKESTSKLDEVQIQAYGTTTRRLGTGNISTVKAKDIGNQVISDPILALKGMVPGMTIVQSTGMPGAAPKINIRGVNSFFNGTEPLVLIDGTPIDAKFNQLLSSQGGGRSNSISALSFINPNDVESIDVLKDADATAIYGSRGANGVILITTKKGKSGDTKIDFRGQYGIGSVAKHRDLLNTQEYLEMRREAFANDRIIPSDDPSESRLGYKYAPDLTVWDQNAYTDWQKEFLGTSRYTNADLSISGGGSNHSFLISGNYNRQTTVFPGDSYTQAGKIRFSLSNTSKNGKFSSNLSGGFTTDRSFYPNLDFIQYFDLPPNAPNLLNQDGTLNWAINPLNGSTTWPGGNPYSKTFSEVVEPRNNALLGNLELGYNILPELQFQITSSVNHMTVNTFGKTLIEGIEPRFRNSATASARFSNAKNFSWQTEPLLSYKKRLGNSTIGILVGATLLARSAESQRLIVNGIRDDAYIRNPASGISSSGAGEGTQYRYTAYYGRASYSYLNKYLLNATIRTDGSSRFGPNKQFKEFGAIGAGWIFSEEGVLKNNLSFLSFGKLRGSWGVSGNDQIGDYRYLDTYVFAENIAGTNATYQGIKPLKVTSLFNPDYGWEKTIKLEFGIELGFLKDRILTTASWYKNKSDNQLLSNELPAYVGFPRVQGNLDANMENIGQEYTLTSKNISTKSFDWSTSFNISRQRNRVLSYNSISAIANNASIQKITEQKKSIGSLPLRNMTYLDPETGTFMFEDFEGISGPAWNAIADAIILDPSPRFYGGIQNSFRYKQFQMDMFFQFVRQKGKSTRYSNVFFEMPGTMNNQDRYVLNRWTKPGDVSNVRKFSQNIEDELATLDFQHYLDSDANFQDASYLRCTNLSISWGLPKNILDKAGIRNCRIYVQGQNLFTVSPYDGWDPETQSNLGIPPLRIITTGIQLSL